MAASPLSSDLDLAHAAGFDFGARLAGRVTLDEVIGDLRCGVAEVDRVPDGEFLRRARLDRTGHFRRQAEAGHVDLADLALVFDGLRGGQNADRRRSDDDLDVGVRLQRPWLRGRTCRKVIAINGRDEVQAGKSFSCFFISPIQMFWLVEVVVADRMAKSPLPPSR
jgi:hypothetical protein